MSTQSHTGEDPLGEMIQGVYRLSDAEQRLIASNDLTEQVQHLEQQIREIRQEAIRELHDNGWTYQQIAEFVGLSKGRVIQLALDYSTPGRAGAIENTAAQAAAEARGKDLSAHEAVAYVYSECGGLKRFREVTAEQWAQYSQLPVQVWREFLTQQGGR